MLTDLQLRLLWFLLAGFILGFATSYLWEVLYARGRRWREEIERANEMRFEQRYVPPAPTTFTPAAATQGSYTPAPSAAHSQPSDEERLPQKPSVGTEEDQLDFGAVNVYQSPDFYLDSEADGPALDWSSLAFEELPPTLPADDFTQLEGVRKPHAEALYRADIYSFEQLAGLMPREVMPILPDDVDEEEVLNWLTQALDIAQERRARVAERAPLNSPRNG